MKINLEVLIIQEDVDSYTAYSPALELSTYGDSIKDVEIAFKDAVEIFIEDTTKKGTFEKELLKLGWQLKQIPEPSYLPPSPSYETFQKLKPISTFNQPIQIAC